MKNDRHIFRAVIGAMFVIVAGYLLLTSSVFKKHPPQVRIEWVQ